MLGETALPVPLIQAALPVRQFAIEIAIEYAIAEGDSFTFAAEAA